MEESGILHDGKKYFKGYHITHLMLKIGNCLKMPFSFRVYCKGRGRPRTELAKDMLESILKIFPYKPRMILFDSICFKRGFVR